MFILNQKRLKYSFLLQPFQRKMENKRQGRGWECQRAPSDQVPAVACKSPGHRVPQNFATTFSLYLTFVSACYGLTLMKTFSLQQVHICRGIHSYLLFVKLLASTCVDKPSPSLNTPTQTCGWPPRKSCVALLSPCIRAPPLWPWPQMLGRRGGTQIGGQKLQSKWRGVSLAAELAVPAPDPAASLTRPQCTGARHQAGQMP